MDERKRDAMRRASRFFYAYNLNVTSALQPAIPP